MILLILIQLASNQPMTIEADPRCPNVPELVYIVGDVVCVPSDTVFRQGFES